MQAQVLNLRMELQADLGLSFLFISHDIAVVERISHHVGVMYLGRLVELAAAGSVRGPAPPLYQDADVCGSGRRSEATAHPRSPEREPDRIAHLPLAHRPEPSTYDEVTPGHFVLRQN